MATVRQMKEAYRKASRDTVKDLANIVLERGSQVIQEEALDRGDLLSSGEIELEKEKPVAWVRWTAAHAPFVHWGTRPHWPPFAPILAWVKRNLMRYTPTGGGKPVDVIRPTGKIAERARRSPDSAAVRIARAIQAKIAREGTAPVPFASKGAAEANRKASSILSSNINNRFKSL